jgi:hypothetical protein
MIYRWNPLELGEIINNEFIIKKSIKMPNIFNYVRGSTNCCTFKNQKWFISHIVSSSKNYYHLIIIFDENMNLIKYSYPFTFSNIPIEYCIGLIVEDDRIIITYSVWDSLSYIITINKKEINSIFPHDF